MTYGIFLLGQGLRKSPTIKDLHHEKKGCLTTEDIGTQTRLCER